MCMLSDGTYVVHAMGNVTYHGNPSTMQVVAVRLFKGQATESACMQHRLHLEKALELGEPSPLLFADTLPSLQGLVEEPATSIL